MKRLGLCALTLLLSCGGSPAKTPIKTVFLILLENHDWRDLRNTQSAPYLNRTLLPLAAHAENYKNPPNIHPSEPNYLWLEAGTNFGVLDDNPPAANHQATKAHLVTLLEAAGVSWKSYQEGIDGSACPLDNTAQGYAPRHNPVVFFDDVTNGNDPAAARCLAHVRPYSELAADLAANTVPRYAFLTPSLCDDMHDSCAPKHDAIAQGDAWLAAEVPKLLASTAYANGGAIFITWDEGEGDDGPIGFLALSANAKPGYASAVAFDHGSTLRTLEEIFGVTPLLGSAATATDLSDLFVTFP